MGSCLSGEAFDLGGGGGGVFGLPLLRWSCLRARPEVALVSSECMRAEGAGSYPRSSFLCLCTSFRCPCLCPVCVFRCTCLSTCISLTACLHMCVCMSLFPQVLVTAPPRTHTEVSVLHLSFSPRVSVAVHVSRCLCVQRQGEARPNTHTEGGDRQCHPREPVYVCACMCTEMPGSWVNKGEKVVLTDGAAHPETLQGASICQLPGCSPSSGPDSPSGISG